MYIYNGISLLEKQSFHQAKTEYINYFHEFYLYNDSKKYMVLGLSSAILISSKDFFLCTASIC